MPKLFLNEVSYKSISFCRSCYIKSKSASYFSLLLIFLNKIYNRAFLKPLSLFIGDLLICTRTYT